MGRAANSHLQRAEHAYQAVGHKLEMDSYGALGLAAQEASHWGVQMPTGNDLLGIPPRYSSSFPAVGELQKVPGIPPPSTFIVPPAPEPCTNPQQTLYNGYACNCLSPGDVGPFTSSSGAYTSQTDIDAAIAAGIDQFGAGGFSLCLDLVSGGVSAVAGSSPDASISNCITQTGAPPGAPPMVNPACSTSCNAQFGKYFTTCKDSVNCTETQWLWGNCGPQGDCPKEPWDTRFLPGNYAGCYAPNLYSEGCNPATGMMEAACTDPETCERTVIASTPCLPTDDDTGGGGPIDVPAGCCPPAEINFRPVINVAPTPVHIENTVDVAGAGCDAEDDCSVLIGVPIDFEGDHYGVWWDDPDACKQVEVRIEQFANSFYDLVGWVKAEVPPDAPGKLNWFQPISILGIEGPWKLAWEAGVAAFNSLLKTAVDVQAAADRCHQPSLMPLYSLRIILGMLNRFLGVDVTNWVKEIDYSLNYICPKELPTQAQATQAYLANEINWETWECWTMANNKLPKTHETLVHAERAKPNINDTISLYLREHWNEERARKSFRDNGVLEEEDLQAFYRLADFIPPYTDLVRMMVRDSFDDQVATTYGYDDEFDIKFGGEAKKWAKAQGIDERVFKYLWRAHWQLPSPTQGYEMLHRLRPKRVDDDVVTEPADIEKLLGINDIPTYWRKRLMAVSYSVLRLVDIRNAYFRGVFDLQEVIEQLKDRGYSPADAERASRLFKAEKRQWIIAKPITGQYVSGDATWRELRERYRSFGMEDAEIDDVTAELNQRQYINNRKRCIAALKKRYLCGEIDDSLATGNLVELGFDGNEATNRVVTWRCELIGKCRQPTAKMLCDWLATGLITRPDMVRRLQRLGYSPDAAERIALICQVKAQSGSVKQQKRQEQQQKQEDKRKEREQEQKQKKEEVKEKEKRRAQGQASKAQTSIMAGLIKTARSLAKLTGEHWRDTLDEVRGMVCQLHTEKGIAEIDALKMIDELIGGAKDEGEDSISEAFAALLEMLPSRPSGGVPCAANGLAG